MYSVSPPHVEPSLNCSTCLPIHLVLTCVYGPLLLLRLLTRSVHLRVPTLFLRLFAHRVHARVLRPSRAATYATATLKLDAAAVAWVTKVFTVGGTLALSGGVVGAAIMLLASVVVFAIFANRN